MSSRIRASAACGSRIAFRRAAAASRWKLASLICATISAQGTRFRLSDDNVVLSVLPGGPAEAAGFATALSSTYPFDA